MQRINAFLRSEAAILTVLLMSLAAQTPHAAYVFRNIAGDNIVTGWTFAIAMESAVLLFVVRGRARISYGFAAVSIAMNLSYYAMHSVGIFTVQAFPVWLVSVVLPVAIALYSHDIASIPTIATVEHKPQSKAQPATVQERKQALPKPEPKPQPATVQDDMHNLSADERRDALRRMLSNGKADWTNVQFAELFDVHPATIARDKQHIKESA